jgi:hypothetical protein
MVIGGLFLSAAWRVSAWRTLDASRLNAWEKKSFADCTSMPSSAHSSFELVGLDASSELQAPVRRHYQPGPAWR